MIIIIVAGVIGFIVGCVVAGFVLYFATLSAMRGMF
jgi:hypothetical protein